MSFEPPKNKLSSLGRYKRPNPTTAESNVASAFSPITTAVGTAAFTLPTPDTIQDVTVRNPYAEALGIVDASTEANAAYAAGYQHATIDNPLGEAIAALGITGELSTYTTSLEAITATSIQDAKTVESVVRVQTTFEKLSNAATELNVASDELGRAAELWESILKQLNLGVSAWVKITGSSKGDEWWDRGIGYTQINDKWGLALRERKGHEPSDTFNDQTWAFSLAPRWLRVAGLPKIPELLEALLKQAEETTQKLRRETERAMDYAKLVQGKPATKAGK